LGQRWEAGERSNEKLVVTPKTDERWPQRFELNLFTGRTGRSFSFTFDRWPATKIFSHSFVLLGDAKRKPHPEGSQKILGAEIPPRRCTSATTFDDALAAQDAGVPFLAIIARAAPATASVPRASRTRRPGPSPRAPGTKSMAEVNRQELFPGNQEFMNGRSRGF